MSWRWPCLMLSDGGVSNYYVVSVGGREYVKGRRYMFLPWRHTQCHGEVRPGGAAKAGTAHESGLGRRRRRRGHLRRRRVGHERLEGVELLLRRRRRRLARGAQAEGRRRVGSGGGRLAGCHGRSKTHGERGGVLDVSCVFVTWALDGVPGVRGHRSGRRGLGRGL